MKFKNLFPFRSFTFISNDKIETVRINLARLVDANRQPTFSLFRYVSQKEFIGKVEENHFVISRTIYHRNSFLPIITGSLSSLGNQTIIDIKMRVNYFVLAFITFWLSVVGLFCLIMTIMLIANLKAHDPKISKDFMILIPYGMFLMGSLLFIFPFRYEVKKAKELLLFHLNASEHSNEI
ncbi:MAG TPA: hypothetical protein VFF27_13585 [Bacteroidia bacterium]|jgi:hypothetical protein|nr:hypothetical protein [Bacteroidia bacterium]